MRGRVVAMALVGLTALSGCVTASVPEETTGRAATAAPGPANVDEAPVSAAAAVSGDPSLDWQKTLADDASAVEAKGNAFLEASFQLYDQLLDDGVTTPARRQQISAAVKESANLYADLAAVVQRLRMDLSQPEIRQSLPLTGDEGKREFDGVGELVAAYQRTDRHGVAYDPAQGPSITAVLFNDKEHGEASGLDGLPKQQRDALLLIDYLRQVSNDLAYVSHTVSDWVDVRKTLGTDLEDYAH